MNFLKEVKITFKILYKEKLNLVGLVIVGSFVIISILVSIFGYSILPYNPIEPNLSETLLPPSLIHPLGTDDLGRDTLSRILAAAPLDLMIALIVVIPSSIIGTMIGVTSGYFGGKLDEVIMRITDIFLAFPGLVLALAIAAILGPSIINTMTALMIVWWPYYTRLARGEALAIKENLYVEAAKAIGLRDFAIIMRHVIPNVIPPIIIYATLDLGRIILAATVLSYIGLGAQPPIPEWGRMVSDTQVYLFSHWWLPLAPAAIIFIVVLGFNLLGDGLRDAYEPRLRQLFMVKSVKEESLSITRKVERLEKKEGELLTIKSLQLIFKTPRGTIRALNNVSLWLNKKEVLGIAGESGSGKTVLGLSILGLVPKPPGEYPRGEIWFKGKDLLKLSEKELNLIIRGTGASMIFQEPLTALNPVLTVGEQVAEAIKVRMKKEGIKKIEKSIIKREVTNIFKRVGIPDPEIFMKRYPHELSGGMRQRVMISIALAMRPLFLIADEPTTALDVTTQAQILQLMKEIIEEENMSIIYITHDLSIIAEIADRVIIMYAGEVVESGSVGEIFKKPLHPYTQGLLNAIPTFTKAKIHLIPIAGSPPDPLSLPKGCRFHPRCPYVMPKCYTITPELREIEKDHIVACHLYYKQEE